MNLKIYSLIFIISIVLTNSFKKIEYSDIFTSLAELNNYNPSELAKIRTTVGQTETALLQPHTQINNLIQTHYKSCQNTENNFARYIKLIETNFVNMKRRMQLLSQDTYNLKQKLSINLNYIQVLDREIVNINQNKEKTFSELKENEKLIITRLNVLVRLSNLIQDELTGESRSSTVTKFNVNKEFSKNVGFVELNLNIPSLSNDLKQFFIHDDLQTKSLVSSLISLTKKKNLFANSNIVNKINALLDKIKQDSSSRLKGIRKQYSLEHQKFKVIYDRAQEKNFSLKSKNSEIETTLNMNMNMNKNYEKELEKLKKYLTTKKKLIEHIKGICKKQTIFFKRYENHVQTAKDGFKNILSYLE